MGVRTIAYDHNEMGLKLAKNFKNDSAFKAVDINKDVFNENVHGTANKFEHLSDPLGFLYHVKKCIERKRLYLY